MAFRGTKPGLAPGTVVDAKPVVTMFKFRGRTSADVGLVEDALDWVRFRIARGRVGANTGC